jgi:oleandomycin transport system ATP-binding protein
MSYAIHVEGLVKRYGETVALDGVDLRVPAGTVAGVLGPAGAGKTTLIRVLAGLTGHDAGRVTIGGTHPTRKGPTQKQPAREEPPGEGPARDEKARDEEVRDEPDVLLLDEPTAGLDPHARDEKWEMIRRVAGDGTTVLLTTRSPEEVGQLADRIIALDRGRVVAEGRAGELKQRIGGQVLHVRATVAADGDSVARILHELTGTVPARDAGTGLLTVPAGNPMLVSALVRRLDTAGIPVDELGLRVPSLDEVLRSLR